jgi:hypothetical protein
MDGNCNLGFAKPRFGNISQAYPKKHEFETENEINQKNTTESNLIAFLQLFKNFQSSLQVFN